MHTHSLTGREEGGGGGEKGKVELQSYSEPMVMLTSSETTVVLWYQTLVSTTTGTNQSRPSPRNSYDAIHCDC